eukprot:TRINITY_DN3161_c3_g1_i2.p1 TRINITY_DN3161_c3_g1~~TRINITY_DN3161_c3_g1_i2.p1  ORF type:complete len:115 (+),score=16.83 TRINITY_DN3161_c3_g1_i2:16-360(+)
MGCNQSTHDGPSEIAHFDSQAQEPIEIPVKLLLLGDSGVGKSSLMIRQCDQEFNFNTLSTVGIDFKEQRIEINEKQIKLQIWDTAGMLREFIFCRLIQQDKNDLGQLQRVITEE